jgi:opacity protein-like surface antigen
MDMLKILVGSNGYDGFIGREGVTGWGFHQTVTDTGVGFGGDGVWSPNIYGVTSMINMGGMLEDMADPEKIVGSLTYRDAFFEGGGDGGNAVYLFITPTDMFGINIILPFFAPPGTKTADVFGKAVVQADVKLEGMSFSLTYQGGLGSKDESEAGANDAVLDPGKLFLYANLGMVENLGIDIGIGYTLPGSMSDGDVTISAPIAAGLGVKYDMGDFKVKFRTVASFGGSVKVKDVDDPYVPGFGLLLEVLPYFAVNDNLTVYAGIGYGMKGKDKAGGEEIDKTDQSGFSFNPYIVVGEEWGPKFIAGIKIWQSNAKDKEDNKYINWAVPIALCVGF